MTVTKKDMFDLTARIQMDLRDLTTRVVELRAMLAATQLPDDAPKHACPQCGVARPTQQALLEHMANVHNDELAGRPENTPHPEHPMNLTPREQEAHDDSELLQLAHRHCTPKQIATLELAAKGFGTTRIATIQGISRQAVDQRIANAIRTIRRKEAECQTT